MHICDAYRKNVALSSSGARARVEMSRVPRLRIATLARIAFDQACRAENDRRENAGFYRGREGVTLGKKLVSINVSTAQCYRPREWPIPIRRILFYDGYCCHRALSNVVRPDRCHRC